jgi:glycosyltransferase involved in cell wall biosynthesis
MAGGLEKNIIRLANFFSEAGYETHLISFDRPGAEAYYEINKKVIWDHVGVGKPHFRNSFADRIQLIKNIRSTIKTAKNQGKKAKIVCFHHGILARFFAATLFIPVSILCSERNSLSIYKHINKSKWNINFLLLSLCKKIVVQFPEYIANYPFWMRSKIVSIPNSVTTVTKIADPGRANRFDRFNILAVGRLSAQKQIHLLINSFAEIGYRYPLWDLIIVGEGILKKKLVLLSKGLRMQDRIIFTGNTEDVSSWMEMAHIFCMPSKWEGFPNSLAEALAHGLPAIGYSECEGVNKLIVNNENGLLVNRKNNGIELQRILEMAISNPVMLSRMSANARRSIRKYNTKRVERLWLKVLFEI